MQLTLASTYTKNTFFPLCPFNLHRAACFPSVSSFFWRARARAHGLQDSKVFELERGFFVNVFREERLPVQQRGPVSVFANHRHAVRLCDLEHTLVIDLVRLADASLWVLHCPDHPRERRGGDLEGGGRVVLDQLPGVVDFQLRAVPVRTFCVPAEQDAKLVNAFGNLVHHQPLFSLLNVVLPGKLVEGEHGIVARVVRVVHGRPVGDGVAFLHGEVVGDRNGLVVRDQKAVKLVLL